MGILDGIRVLDFGRYIAAPWCAQLLADMGAEVIRVERPGGEPDRHRGPLSSGGVSLYYVSLNRNKKAITLDLSSVKGRSLLSQLVKTSDVLIHNHPVQRAKLLGLSYPRLKKINHRLIYLGISGFGVSSPYSAYPAFDPIIQSISGASDMTGFEKNGPTMSHVPYIDFTTGLFGALAVSLALVERHTSGVGQSIDLSLYNAALSLVASYGAIAECAVNKTIRRSVGNDFIYAVGGVYPTIDGRITISSIGDGLWKRLCLTIDRSDLLRNVRLSNDIDRYKNRDLVNAAIGGWTSLRTTKDAIDILLESGIPTSPMVKISEVESMAKRISQEMITYVDQPGVGVVPVGGVAIKFGRTPGEISRNAPGIGENNEEIYDGILGDGAVKQLYSKGTI